MTTRRAPSDPASVRLRDTLFAVIAVLFVIAGLRASAPVTMPLGFAILLIALCWPIQEWLNRRLSRRTSYVGTAIALFLVLAGLLVVLFFSGRSIASAVPKYTDELQQTLDSLRSFAQLHGLPAPSEMFQANRLGSLAQNLVMGIYRGLGLLLFILALTILGLPAVPKIRDSVEAYFGDDGHDPVGLAKGAANKVQRWLAMGTLTSAITGVLTGLFALIVGLDLAFLWGVIAFILNYIPTVGIAFILNYIPTVGSVIAVIPPVLFSFLQFDGLLMPIVILLGLSAIQLVMGNFVYPQVAGRSLVVLPVVLLFSIAFWGWVWGVPGALLATPLTTTIIIVCGEFERTRWIAALLSREREPESVDRSPSAGSQDRAPRPASGRGD